MNIMAGPIILKSVAPLAGAWIEILLEHVAVEAVVVAPLAGAWIEITLTM